jgi:signal transduction histidine kinase
MSSPQQRSDLQQARAVVSSMPLPVVLLDGEGVVLAASQAASLCLGAAVVVGERWSESHEESVPLGHAVHTARTTGQPLSTEHLLARGHRVQLQVAPWALGTSTSYLATLTDLGPAAESADAEVGAHNEGVDLVDRLGVGVIAATAEGSFTVFNREAERLLSRGAVDTDVEGWTPYYELTDLDGRVVPTEDLPMVRALGGETVRGHILGVGKGEDGPRRWVLVSSDPLDDGGGVVAFHDVTELLQTQRDLEEFAYAASHDLHEPLRMISGFVDLLQAEYGEQLTGEAQEYMGYIVDGADRMKRLVHDLLQVSKYSSMALRSEAVDLATVLTEVRQDLSTRIEETGATIEAELLPVVQGDPTQLRQLVQNLLGNALKFQHPDRPLQVRISARRQGLMWRVEVSDNGIGIEPRHREVVFKMFQRLHARAAYGGTGIGLALCKRVVERHGGAIGVADTPGPGSTFWCTLPATPSPGNDLSYE